MIPLTITYELPDDSEARFLQWVGQLLAQISHMPNTTHADEENRQSVWRAGVEMWERELA